MNNKIKDINIHADYIMFQLMSNLRSALSIVTTYMQQTTPYGKEYEKAYEMYNVISERLIDFEGALAECVERKGVK